MHTYTDIYKNIGKRWINDFSEGGDPRRAEGLFEMRGINTLCKL